MEDTARAVIRPKILTVAAPIARPDQMRPYLNRLVRESINPRSLFRKLYFAGPYFIAFDRLFAPRTPARLTHAQHRQHRTIAYKTSTNAQA
ncbi:hypothetical protein T7987_05285 [Sulfitobacter faviae]|uniref:Uncharacterized protein n=1 Tax=Sulfitobacter faviae TaxID=1775881 RepID=A0ABZ0V418_9RHOB|nr:hypothetical protein [Sulfitobacter faviae]WPZ22662.1 hypothetical protein T7987_05285 [Sulfitobacter faviae]